MESKPEPPPLPYRANQHPIATPTSDGESLSSYGLFGCLPLEIRQQILTETFGNKVLHISLSLDHPLVVIPKKGSASWFTSDEPGLEVELHRDARQPKDWSWFGCVCRRPHIRHDGNPEIWKSAVEPWEDDCVPGTLILGRRAKRGAPDPDACYPYHSESLIRVMSWLLACRQAYMDGTQVLYSTNTFHMGDLILIRNLPDLMPSHHLAAMTSLELVWDFARDDQNNSNAGVTMRSIWDAAAAAKPSSTSTSAPSQPSTAFHHLCRMVPSTFPNLRRLYIALQAFLVPPEDFPLADYDDDLLGAVERVVLAPIEDLFRALGPARGKDFSLAIQHGGWRVFADRLTLEKGGKGKENRERDPRAFRCFEVVAMGERSFREKLWKPLGDGEHEGYWLCPGWDDFALFGHSYWLFDIWRTGDIGGVF
ncbi:hypothetical protein VTK26DRAFT_3777 [Humicola hyalothermophila]